jgi:hypothetical protein
VPYHWGTFNHVTSTAYDAIERLRLLVQTHHRAEGVRILEPGHYLEHIPGNTNEPSAHSIAR